MRLIILALLLSGCGTITPLSPESTDAASTIDTPDAGATVDASPPPTFPTCPNPINSGYVDCNQRVKGYECVKAGPWENGVDGCAFMEPGVLPLKVTVSDCSVCPTL